VGHEDYDWRQSILIMESGVLGGHGAGSGLCFIWSVASAFMALGAGAAWAGSGLCVIWAGGGAFNLLDGGVEVVLEGDEKRMRAIHSAGKMLVTGLGERVRVRRTKAAL